MKGLLAAYGFLIGAVACEIVATTALARCEQFTRLLPTLITVAGYTAAFYLLSLSLRVIPIGIAYAIWSGVGIVLISAIGFFLFRQSLDWAACLGLGFIIAGVLVVNLFSTSIRH